VIFGAAALSHVGQERADEILALIIDAGINHIDTAAGYGKGESERRIAPWLRTHRLDFFLATKTSERTADGARRGLEASLERLGVDSIDLIQLHNLVEPDEWEIAHSAGGAVEALIHAREEGLVRFIGVTGHGTRIPSMHVRSLAHFPFDSVLLPFNYTMLSNPTYRADVEELLTLCAERNVAVQTIKAIARRRWQTTTEGDRRSWYEPLAEREAISRVVRYVLGRPQLFLNSSSDYTLLPAVLDAASGSLLLPNEAELAADVASYDMAPLFDGLELERM